MEQLQLHFDVDSEIHKTVMRAKRNKTRVFKQVQHPPLNEATRAAFVTTATPATLTTLSTKPETSTGYRSTAIPMPKSGHDRSNDSNGEDGLHRSRLAFTAVAATATFDNANSGVPYDQIYGLRCPGHSLYTNRNFGDNNERETAGYTDSTSGASSRLSGDGSWDLNRVIPRFERYIQRDLKQSPPGDNASSSQY